MAARSSTPAEFQDSSPIFQQSTLRTATLNVAFVCQWMYSWLPLPLALLFHSIPQRAKTMSRATSLYFFSFTNHSLATGVRTYSTISFLEPNNKSQVGILEIKDLNVSFSERESMEVLREDDRPERERERESMQVLREDDRPVKRTRKKKKSSSSKACMYSVCLGKVVISTLYLLFYSKEEAERSKFDRSGTRKNHTIHIRGLA